MSARSHTFRLVDERLQEIGRRTLSVAAAVERQYHLLARALAAREEGALERVVDEDLRVDRGELEIDELVVSFILTLSPVASDLRRVLAATKAARELERAGDEARGAAKNLGELHEGDRSGRLDEPLARAACLVASQLDRACVALVELDEGLAREAVANDREINELTREVRAETLRALGDVHLAVPYLAVGRSIERGGDHAKVIAKFALGAATGVDARHLRLRAGSR